MALDAELLSEAGRFALGGPVGRDALARAAAEVVVKRVLTAEVAQEILGSKLAQADLETLQLATQRVFEVIVNGRADGRFSSNQEMVKAILEAPWRF